MHDPYGLPPLRDPLTFSQAFTGSVTSPNTGHGEGAAQLIKFRGRANSHDIFEQKLILALRGTVVQPMPSIYLPLL